MPRRIRQPPPAPPSRRLPIALGLAAFAAHAVTAPSGLFWLDAGDFVTAAGELGVPHPTGFPVYVLLGKLAALVPAGPMGFRVALLSAALAGMITGLLAYLTMALAPLDRRGWAALAAAAAAVLLWTTDIGALLGRTPEVYALHVGLLLAALVVLDRIGIRDGPGDWLVLGFVVGLGLSTHAEYRLFAPLVLLMAAHATWGRGRHRLRRLVGRGLRALLGIVLGLLPYLYLPLAAGRGPYHAWGHTDTLERVWQHITGLSIQLGFRDELLNTSSARLTHHAQVLGEQVLSDFGTLLVLVPIGVVFLLVQRSRLGLTTLLLALVDVGYAVIVNPMGLVDQQNGGPLYALLALFIALGFVALAELARYHVAARADRAIVTPLLVLGVGVAVLEADPDRVVMTGDWAGEDLVFTGLQEAPEGALVLTATESFAAGRLYLVGLGALRPDTQALHLSDLTDARTLLERHHRGAFALADAEEVEGWEQADLGASDATFHQRLGALLRHAWSDGRAVRWGPGAESESAGLWDHITLGFPLHEVRPEPGAPSASLDDIATAPFLALADDPWGARWLAQYWNWAGTYQYHRANDGAAASAWRRASLLRPEWSAPLVNLGVVTARAGDRVAAHELARQATSVDPLNLTAWLNLARYACLLDDAAAAREAVERARALELDSARERIDDVARFVERCPP